MRAAEFSGLADVVRDAARTCPEHAAIVFEDRTTRIIQMDKSLGEGMAWTVG